jgi:hypothetical protein
MGVGLFRRKDERAIPEPGSREFEEAVEGSALPDAGSVTMGEAGWSEPEQRAEEPDESSEPEEEPQQGESGSDDRPRRHRVLGALGRSVLKPPNADGFGGGVKKR